MSESPDTHKSEEELVQQYLPLALRIARSIRTRDPDSTASDAALALLLAIRSYRPDRGASLKTWLRGNIYRRMIDLLRERTGRSNKPRQLLWHPLSLNRRIKVDGSLHEIGDLVEDHRVPSVVSRLVAEDARRLLYQGESERDQRIMDCLLAQTPVKEIQQTEQLSESGVFDVRRRIAERCRALKARAIQIELEGGHR